MSIAYDYAREATPPVSAVKSRLLLIDGQHVPSASGRTFKTLNPATEQVIATVAEGNEADVDRAVAAHHARIGARTNPAPARRPDETACR